MSTEAAELEMQAAGVPVDEPQYVDYWGFEETHKWYFPDQKQFIEFKVMTEGDRKSFQSLINRDISIKRSTGDAKISADPASERHALLITSVVDWFVTKAGVPQSFSKGSPGANFEQWLAHTNPRFVDDLEFAIRKANPWMQADMTVDEIDKEMDRLRELREDVVKREQGELSSSVK